MKIAVTSDWHPDHVTHGVSRFGELEAAVDRTVQEAIERRVDAYFFLGDLCDPDSGSVVFRCVELALRAACGLAAHEIPSLWLAGNHDVIEDGSGETSLTPLLALSSLDVLRRGGDLTPLIQVAERPAVYRIAGASVLALPYTATSHGYDPAAQVQIAIDANKPFITIGHLSVPGCIPGEETKEMPRGREVLFPIDALSAEGKPHPLSTLRLNGHYHRRQYTNGVHIPGALARLAFGEEENYPGFLIVET